MIKKIAQAGKDLGVDLYLAHVKPQVIRVLAKDSVVDVVSRNHIHGSISVALALHLEKFSSDQVDFLDLLNL